MLEKDVLNMAVQTYGQQMQMDILIEEMAELTKELIKTKRRAWKSGGLYQFDRRVFDEMIDVRVVLDQMEQIFRAEWGDVEFNQAYYDQRGNVLQELLFRIRRDRLSTK